MIKEVFAVSAIAKKRSMANVFMKLSEEVGELATEINIADGYVTNKVEGVDGVLGEAIDVIICAIDLIKVRHGNAITEEEIMEVLHSKLNKWMSKDDEDIRKEIKF